MNCPKCGAKLEYGRICDKCGFKITSDMLQGNEQGRTKGGKRTGQGNNKPEKKKSPDGRRRLLVLLIPAIVILAVMIILIMLNIRACGQGSGTEIGSRVSIAGSIQAYSGQAGHEPEAGSTANSAANEREELITTVRTVLEGSLGNGEKLVAVKLDDKKLTVQVDISGTDTQTYTPEEIARARIGTIAQAILGLGDKYYKMWDSLTLDFGNVIGRAEFDKSMVKDQGQGKYFDVPEIEFKL